MKHGAFARRLFEYALVAAIVCLIPPVFWAEWTTPWFWGPRPTIPQWQWGLFVAIVAPPGWIGGQLPLTECAYGCIVGVSWCREVYIPPPTWAAWEFWRIGFPFWLLAVAVAGELSRAAWRRYPRAKVRAGQS